MDAEEINDEVYELRNTEIKNQLLIKVWDISNTSKELVNKLFEIGVINEKQKNVAESNMEKNNEDIINVEISLNDVKKILVSKINFRSGSTIPRQ